MAYPNPYSSSTALNLLYTLYWRAAGHQQDGGQLTVAELQTPQVNSVFDQFQSQVLITTPTTLDLQELFLRDQSNLQAFPLEYQNYLSLRQVPGFENTEFVPFGPPPQQSPSGLQLEYASATGGAGAVRSLCPVAGNADPGDPAGLCGNRLPPGGHLSPYPLWRSAAGGSV